MNRSDETLFDPRIADWLEDDPYAAPQQVLDVVLAAFPSIKQRRTWRAPWRFHDMSSPLKLAFAMTAVAVAVGGVLIFGSLLRERPNVAAPATASPSAGPSAVVATSSPPLPPVTGLPGTFAFRFDHGDGKDVFLMRPDRSGLVLLTTDSMLESGPILSPDGTKVVFERTDPVATNAEIWIVDADGANEKAITQTAEFEDWPSWSPDGKRIMFTRATISKGVIVRNEVVIRDASSDAYLQPPSADQVVIRRDVDPAAPVGTNAPGFTPTWSPDGSLVAFISDMGGSNQLYTIHVDGTALKKLTTAGATGRPAWSPDSQTIAYQENRVDGCVWRVDAAGTGSQAIAGDHCTNGPVAWSPDGTMVAWAGGGRGAPIWVVNSDGSNMRQLTTDSAYGDLSWGTVAAP
jgi:Tol biopolymer transport system component